ncbi:hypothetical protein TRFO_12946 [Tritrichomonas foetus]|uniref:Uncharacterized protein n=1 Tax=Tritrichomonas foetus TaxID=1144522 RepID=A0A1J4KZM1_9EUKA|nr:hypothetical protein TRFO_12946 [Tritrichomonas foetus]|eukprot:OHT16699.1 hypothetical protein TRFO_12946 [Tritrichomonas foetus]
MFSILVLVVSSRKYCLCQNDRPGNQCTLTKHCQKFHSEEDIINSTQVKDVLNKDETIEFHIYGSAYTKSIELNLTSIRNKTIKLVGCEWKQSVKIVGLSNEISITAESITLFFDEKNITAKKFKLINSFLLNSNRELIEVNCNKFITDAIGITANRIQKIHCNKIINTNQVFTIPENLIELNENTIKPINSHLLDNEETINTISNTGSQSYIFCLCYKGRYSTCLSNQECEDYAVPSDEDHYVTGKEDWFLNHIATAENGTIFKLYVAPTVTDTLQLNLYSFVNEGIQLQFMAADTERVTKLSLKGNKITGTSKEAIASFINVNSLSIDIEITAIITNISLKSTPLNFDANTVIDMKMLKTDAKSIASFTGRLIITEELTLDRTSPAELEGYIYIQSYATINIPHCSAFATTRLRYNAQHTPPTGKSMTRYFISFSDSDDDYEMDFYLGTENITVKMAEETVYTTTTSTALFFENRVTATNIDMEIPPIYIFVDIPYDGLAVILGEKNGTPFPNSTVFTFQYLNDASNNNPPLNITINDYNSSLMEINEFYFIVISGDIQLILMSPDSVTAFIMGISLRYNECPIVLPDAAVATNQTRCYKIGVYDLNSITMDVQEHLLSLTFDNNSVNIIIDGNDPTGVKLPGLTDTYNLITSTNDLVNLSIASRLKESEILALNLVTTGSPNVFFNRSFEEYVELYEVMQKVRIIHMSEIILGADNFNIPMILLEPPITGVCYYNNISQMTGVTNSTFTGNKNTRIGPIINLTTAYKTLIPQQAILASIVDMSSDNNANIIIAYSTLSVNQFYFKNVILSIVNATFNWNSTANILSDDAEDTNEYDPNSSINFEVIELNFDDKSRISQTGHQLLNMTVDKLTVFNCQSILNEQFSLPITVNSNFYMENNIIKQIIVGKDSVTMIDFNNNETALIEQSSDSAILEIETSQNERITLSVNGKPSSVLTNFTLKMTNTAPSIYFDRSWHNVDIPSDFTVVVTSDNLDLDTELLTMPKITVVGQSGNSSDVHIVENVHKPTYTNNLAFYIGIGIFGGVFVITFILAVTGNCVLKDDEQMDYSDESNDVKALRVSD